MNEQATETAVEEHAAIPYSVYVKAWVSLLVITIVMVMWHVPFVLITGMAAKALIIALWFMHLRYERLDFVLYVLLGIFATAIVLYGLIAPDGMQM